MLNGKHIATTANRGSYCLARRIDQVCRAEWVGLQVKHHLLDSNLNSGEN